MGKEKIDEEFLEKASKILDTDKYGDFLIKWASALEAYGTPREFVDSTYFERSEFEVGGISYPFVFRSSPNYEMRKKLMAEQKPYLPRRVAGEYGFKLEMSSCMLCQNVAQGIDSQDHPDVENNVVHDYDDHFILPNRYASELGHSLLLPKNHDDMTKRIAPHVIDKVNNYPPESDKTRGEIMTTDYMNKLIEICDKHHLAGIRNHVLDGMSIPGHDHFHLLPEDSPSISIHKEILGKMQDIGHGPFIGHPQNTPFDTLVIHSEESREITDVAVPILKQMEKMNQVFRLAYTDGYLYISPRNKNEIQVAYHNTGGNLAMHSFDSKEAAGKIDACVPMKGEYDWESVIDE